MVTFARASGLRREALRDAPADQRVRSALREVLRNAPAPVGIRSLAREILRSRDGVVGRTVVHQVAREAMLYTPAGVRVTMAFREVLMSSVSPVVVGDEGMISILW